MPPSPLPSFAIENSELSPSLFSDVYIFRDMGNTGALTYTIPKGMEDKVAIGKLVEVPLQGHREKGIIRKIHSEIPSFAAKEMGNISGEILLTEAELERIEAFALQNLCSVSRVLKLFIPARVIEKAGESPKKEGFLLVKNPETEKLGKRQHEILSLFSGLGEVLSLTFLEEHGISKETLRTLIKKEWVQKVTTEEYPLPTEKKLQKQDPPKNKIFLGSAHSARNSAVFEAIQETIANGKQVLFLLPENFSLFERFQKFSTLLGENAVTVISGGSTDTEKYHAWWKAKRKNKHLFLGTRTALFFPYQNLGLIVVEDVQDQSYKNDAMPRFHARETAELLATHRGADLIFSTACADSETLGERIVPLEKNISSLPCKNLWTLTAFPSPLPQTEIYDMRIEKAGGNTTSLAVPIQHAIAETLKNGEQVIIALNRRGLFRAIFCHACGYIPKCPLCHSSLPTHEKNGMIQFFCQWCGYSRPVSKTCIQCGSSEQREAGEGTQQTEGDLQKLFPEARIIRADRDAMTGKHTHEEIFGGFQAGKYDILIGTQMITKAFDFPHVGLAISLFPEIDLYSSSFRGEEKMFQNLINLRDRLGKSVANPKFLIQTAIPHHPVFPYAVQGEVLPFVSLTLAERKSLHLPPFSKMIRFTFVETNGETVRKRTQKAQKDLQKRFPQCPILLSPPQHFYRKGEFSMSIVVVFPPHEVFPMDAIPKGARTDPYGDEGA
ncbi:MAG: primosomal protein N' [Candidatus Peregrinibacteria bacterium]